MSAIAAMAPIRAQDDSAGASTGADTPTGATDDSVSFQDFYDSLANQGTWVQSSDYGYVWQPQITDPDWAPYTNGHWVYTDDGWTWVSDESWGWATDHYGRWVNIDGTGWVWVPGYTWAPAWVSWRYGEGYAGWAPLPPDSFVGIDYGDDGYDFEAGYHIGGDCDNFYGIGAAYYIFLPIDCLGYRHYHGHYCNRGDNFAIINRTTNVTNLNVGRGTDGSRGRRVSLGGPSLTQVNAASTTPVAKVNLVRTNQRGPAALKADSLAVYAPQVTARTNAQPARVSGRIGPANINRGTDIMRPLAINSRLAGAAATEQQVQQARIAQARAPASAKIATESTSIRPAMRAPLSSFTPISRPAAAPEIYNTSPNGFVPTQRQSSAQGFAPSTQTHPQVGGANSIRTYNNPGTVYPPAPSVNQPHAPATTFGGGSHENSRPTAPAASQQVAPRATPSAPVTSSQSAPPSSTGASRTAPSSGSAPASGPRQH